MKAVNWADVVINDNDENNNSRFEQITPGGYICHIDKVEDNEEKESLKIFMDIDEGEHKDFGIRLKEKTGYDFGYLQIVRGYSASWEKTFKAFLVALEESNRRFYADKFNNDPKKLEGLTIGVVVGHEEYAGRDKNGVYVKKLRPRVAALLPVERIEKGDFTVPALRPMNDYYKDLMANGPVSNSADAREVSGGALPF